MRRSPPAVDPRALGTAAAPKTRPPAGGLREGAGQGRIRSKRERRSAPLAYLQQVEVSPKETPIGGTAAAAQDAKATLVDSRSRPSSRWSPRHRAPTKGEGRSPAAPGPHLGTLRACAPPPPPPAGTPPARARCGVFAPLESRRRGRKYPLGGQWGCWEERRGSATVGCAEGSGRVSCLTASGKKKKPPWNPNGGYSSAHAYSDWLGAAAECTAAVAERR